MPGEVNGLELEKHVESNSESNEGSKGCHWSTLPQLEYSRPMVPNTLGLGSFMGHPSRILDCPYSHTPSGCYCHGRNHCQCRPGFCPQKFYVCSEGARTGSYRDKKPPPLNNNEGKKLSLSRVGRERESGPGGSLLIWGKLLT
jgi:hypothetical protein